MLQTPVSHPTFASIWDEVVAGKARFYIRTYTRAIIIDRKCIARFAKLGAVPIKLHPDGEGFLLASGRQFVYVMPGYLTAIA